MSRYRPVHCLIWNDDKFPFASDDCQLVWFHLFTTPMTGPIGIFKAPLAGLASEKRWPLKRYSKAVREGVSKGFWKIDEKCHVIYFPAFFKHNRPENPNVLRYWIKFYNELPDCTIKAESIQSLKAFAKGWGEGYVNVCQTLGVTFPERSPNVRGNVPETVTVTVTGTEYPPTPQGGNGCHVERFLKFWKAYPKKIGKGAAEKSWIKYEPSEELLVTILRAIEKQQCSIQWQKEGGQFIPNPATWLNQRRWEDELASITTKSKEDELREYLEPA